MDYRFEDIPVTLNGEPYSADGTLCVEYIVHRSSPSTGDRGGPEIMGFSDLSVVLTGEEGVSIEIPSGDMETLTTITRQILVYIDQEYILEEIDASRGKYR